MRTYKKTPPSLRETLKQKGQKLLRALEVGQKRAEALDLRKRGRSYQDIGTALGVTAGAAREYVLKAISESRGHEEEDAVMVRDLEVERLDAMLTALWKKVLKGDTFAIQQALKIMERRAAYLGLDAPKRMEFLGAVATLTPESVTKMTDEELAKRTQDLLLRLTTGLKTSPSDPEPEKEV